MSWKTICKTCHLEFLWDSRDAGPIIGKLCTNKMKEYFDPGLPKSDVTVDISREDKIPPSESDIFWKSFTSSLAPKIDPFYILDPTGIHKPRKKHVVIRHVLSEKKHLSKKMIQWHTSKPYTRSSLLSAPAIIRALFKGKSPNWLFGGFGEKDIRTSRRIAFNKRENAIYQPLLTSVMCTSNRLLVDGDYLPTFLYGGFGSDDLLFSGREKGGIWYPSEINGLCAI
ncbi:hypothetical protein ADUPG1_006504 [Aduncisulcus paluster]|uniref:Uncharacterized protein n=1 Tax=Aduncisulcus paluster TaxID=2918883 RepID=A0ABQ5KLG5_9EUKA|nr:hypothetical protein ADUPG1_006504 [Aduncisulcus paluster]